MWSIQPNVHVKLWIANAVAPGPPAGAATYDGPGQLLAPKTVDYLPTPWVGRLVVPAAAVNPTNAQLTRVGTQSWLQIIDDVAAVNHQYWAIIDMSPSTRPNPLVGGQYLVDALFLAFVLSL